MKNRILMDGDKITLTNDINDITVDGFSVIYINDTEDLNLNILMNDNSNLTILDYNSNSCSRNINVIQNNDSVLNYIHTFSNDNNYNFKYLVNINGNNNTNNIYLSGVNTNNVTIDVDGIVNKKLNNNILNEDVRILNLDGKVKVLPKLHIEVLDVIANHNTAISNIRESDLFYLNNKGIDKEHAIDLIKQSYIFGLFNEYSEFQELIKGR